MDYGVPTTHPTDFGARRGLCVCGCVWVYTRVHKHVYGDESFWELVSSYYVGPGDQSLVASTLPTEQSCQPQNLTFLSIAQ